MFKIEKLQVSPTRARRAITIEGSGRLAKALNMTGRQLLERTSYRANSLMLGIAFIPKPQIQITDDYSVPAYLSLASVATLVSTGVMSAGAEREGINKKHAVKAFLYGLLAGAVGSWALYRFGENADMVSQSALEGILGAPAQPGQAPFWGFSWFGGLVTSVPTMLAYAAIKKIPLGKFLDAMATAGLTFHAIARIGCFLSGDSCWGAETDVPWGFNINGVVHHATPLYETASALLAAGAVTLMAKTKRFTGQLFLSAVSLHTLGRFIIEFWRENPPVLGTGCSSYQLFSLGVFSLSTALLGYMAKRNNHG